MDRRDGSALATGEMISKTLVLLYILAMCHAHQQRPFYQSGQDRQQRIFFGYLFTVTVGTTTPTSTTTPTCWVFTKNPPLFVFPCNGIRRRRLAIGDAEDDKEDVTMSERYTF